MPRRFLSLAPAALALTLVVACLGCARAPVPSLRRQTALDAAAVHGLRLLPPSPARLPVTVLGRDGPGADLVVYIEGDGLAFLDRHTPSPDPTPVNPLALTLAGLDPAPKLAYLGRPCQYAAPLPETCRPALWTGARFGAEALDALDTALTAAKAALSASRLHLVGYSGGGAMAVLLAARRDDVVELVTVAANLDTEVFAAWHRVTPLAASANPADVAKSLAGLPQVHVGGQNDLVCPPMLIDAFLDRQGRPPGSKRRIVPGATHHKGLAEAWPQVLADIRRQAPGEPPARLAGVASPSKKE